MERVGKRRRGPPPLHDMAVHMDGAINQVIMTSVYVLYVDKCSGEVTQGGSGARRRAQLREQRGRPDAQGCRGAAVHSQQFHVRFSGVFCAALCQARRLAKRRAVVVRGVLEHQNVLGNWNIPRDHEPPPPPSVGPARHNWFLRVPPLRESVQNKGNAAAPQM